jgi:release factor glutamine methyltransferase
VSITARVAEAATMLLAAGLSAADARQDAGVLARHVLGWSLEQWLAHQRDDAPADFAAAFAPLIARRVAREPLAYILGEREFYWRSFLVTPATLIPRPETELIIDAALQASGATRYPQIVDVGTGSGCIAITLAAELPTATVIATDISAAALETATVNAARHGVTERVAFRHGAFFAGIDSAVDLIVSNPPYVPDRDRATMAPEVEGHEPSRALFAGSDGLDCIRPLLALTPDQLRSGGTLIFEFGFGQAGHIKQLIACQPSLRLQALLPDLQGIPRVAIVQRT